MSLFERRQTAPLTAADVRAARPSTTTFRQGYEIEEVDLLLERAAQALEAKERGLPPTLSAEQVLNAKFRPTKFRSGYAMDDVDDLLDRLVAALR